jgi:hypothetical protein
MTHTSVLCACTHIHKYLSRVCQTYIQTQTHIHTHTQVQTGRISLEHILLEKVGVI